ncbi:3-deoxy-D-manno-octulosonic acid transferase [Candidatus Endobugula sertula]|uniref:3-deoxy-D-manno-octulosonic acid transferase n=1 Tax=Candidatus Endobugula sertula TaxID=62101 RepID=A0A1D2QRY8_9GAMM|nr:3-deoxy-D-manno-octulosonic acid transferase [Candidatus Endobugula sertula]
MPLFYTLLFYLSVPLILLRLLWRSIKAPQYRQRWSERFGYLPSHISRPQTQPLLWLHTVSVGETIAAKPLVDALLEQYPEYCLLITTMTPTGSAQVKKQFATVMDDGNIMHCYIPYDLPDCVARFLTGTQPQLAIFMETEVWPNILGACQRHNIPTLLVNARLSERSFNGYQKFLWLTGSVFSRLSAIAAQNEGDARRLQDLGAPKPLVTGSLKSEITISDKLQKAAQQLKSDWSLGGQHKIIIAASTHEGEDEIILSAYQQMLSADASLLLVLAPRHPERFNRVNQLCLDQGFSVQRRSANTHVVSKTQIILADTIGELMLLYGVADIAIIGGSFVAHGGHNMLEPAAWGLPIVSGPSVFNFAKIAQDMQERKGLLVVEQTSVLSEELITLLTDANQRKVIGNNAKEYLDHSKGALSKTMKIINRYVSM